MEQRTGDSYVPTNATSSTITSEMEEEYRTWFVKKIKLASDNYNLSVKSGIGFHWRQHLKKFHKTCEITKNVLKILPMCTQWLRRSEKRMKKKILLDEKDGNDGEKNNNKNDGDGGNSNSKDGDGGKNSNDTDGGDGEKTNDLDNA